MKPMLSCAGVGLYPNFASGMESNACAMFRCSPVIRALNAAVIGLATGAGAGGGGGAGCCAASNAGNDRAIVTLVKDFIVVGSLWGSEWP